MKISINSEDVIDLKAEIRDIYYNTNNYESIQECPSCEIKNIVTKHEFDGINLLTVTSYIDIDEDTVDITNIELLDSNCQELLQ